MNKFSAHLQRCWWKYLAIALVVVAIWALMFNKLAVPADNEKIAVSFIGSKLDTSAFEENLHAAIAERTSQKIRDVSVEVVLSNDDYMFAMIMATRLLTKDLIIVEEKFLTQDFCKDYFLPLPQEKVLQNFPDAQLYSENGVAYGFVLDNPNNNFAEFYHGADKCVAFISSKSPNAMQFYGKGEPADDAAICAIQFLLENK
ncbi:MAG: hypothetical protein ACI4QL_03575 [Candidatus Fimimonas sp.]